MGIHFLSEKKLTALHADIQIKATRTRAIPWRKYDDKKLRIKFIIVSMVSLTVVLFLFMGVIILLNYWNLERDADGILTILMENDGHFPKGGDRSGDKQLSSSFPEEPPPIFEPAVSPELPYESRYFSVKLNSQGETVTVDTGKIAAVDTSTAIEYAQSVWRSGSGQGFFGNYRYKMDFSGNETSVIFLDCGRSLDTFRTFLANSTIVSVIGILLVLLLMTVLSARIVKPFSENYEKQKRFITDAGHELKTPLTIIDADAEILEMDYGENEWIKDIHTQTKRLAELTNSLILLSRMEETGGQSQMLEFLVSDVAEEVVGNFQTLTMTQHKSLMGHIQPMLSMFGDENAIRRLFGILLDNAVKYSDAESEIVVTLEKQKNTLRFSVFNRTSNLSKETVQHLFDRFYRGDPSRNSQIKGYGLGLSIASAIVAAHKGRISANAQDGNSMLITVTFPV